MLTLRFTPGLENARACRVALSPHVTSTDQRFDVRGLIGDVNSDGLVNATDRSVVVGVWTGSGFSCETDLNLDATTHATDRSIVVGAWTSGNNSAPCKGAASDLLNASCKRVRGSGPVCKRRT